MKANEISIRFNPIQSMSMHRHTCVLCRRESWPSSSQGLTPQVPWRLGLTCDCTHARSATPCLPTATSSGIEISMRKVPCTRQGEDVRRRLASTRRRSHTSHARVERTRQHDELRFLLQCANMNQPYAADALKFQCAVSPRTHHRRTWKRHVRGRLASTRRRTRARAWHV